MNWTLKIITIAVVISMTTVLSCDKNELEARDNFDRQLMLEHIADEVITPAFNNLEDDAILLNQSIQIFVASSTQANLDNLQLRWSACAQSWEYCTAFNLGAIFDSYIYNKIEFRPTSQVFIEDYIATASLVDDALIESAGSSSKGLPAIEYLIFNELTDQVVIDSFTVANNLINRQNYLLSLGHNLESKTLEVLNLWEGGYQTTFVSSQGSEIGSSIGLLANQMTTVLERILVKHLAKSLGKSTDGIGHPEEVEAPLSGQSLDFIKYNLESVYQAFCISDLSDKTALDDYLDAVGAKYGNETLPDKIRAQFDLCREALNAIPGPLKDAVVTDYQLVDAAYTEIRELLILFKVDVASQLSITITFNDNDGD
jgi:predicted lipoprotein